ncbi:MAG: glucose-6-phosphate dehydrogenase, partial [Acidobacteria bacterium]
MADAPTTLVIIGASGDLTRRLLLPGLGSLLAVEPDREVVVVGADRDEMSQEDWGGTIRAAFAEADTPQETVDRVVGQARYDMTDALDEGQLRELIGSVEGDLVIYFALPPQVTVKVCALLEKIPLPEGTMLAMEKPFGHDLASAVELNRQATRVVPENQIFRIDHFLGVNTVLNLLGLRFANRIFQPLWSAEHIERVEIFYDESLALEGRAGYYDRAGALIDMTQSHLLQVLSMFAMESPASMEAEELQSLKSQVLRATSLWGDDPATATRRARYTAGHVGGKDVPDYVDEEGVDPANKTETLSEVVLEVRNLSKRFGGITAVDDVSFDVHEGEILGLIGPNGSGKSTLFNCILGQLAPSAGEVRVDGHGVTGLRPSELNRRGVSRTFQLLQVFPKLTVRENLILAGQEHQGRMLARLFGKRDAGLSAQADRMIAFFRLSHLAEETAGSLSYGQQKLLDAAMAFMAGPRLVLLDEPAGGVNLTMLASLKER